MKKAYFNILIILGLSWLVYGICQEDRLLPSAAVFMALITWLLRPGQDGKDKTVFEKIPLSALIIVSYLAGMFWRTFAPIPENASSPFPEFTAALQSGSIIAAGLIWLKPMNQRNLYQLVFCAWLTTALSMNVPFKGPMLMIFTLFCFTAIAVMILFTRRRPEKRKYVFIYSRDFFLNSILMIMLTVVLFLGISRTIAATESAFYNVMGDFIMPRMYTNFLRLSSQLNLINPGVSATDRRPVMEIRLPPGTNSYLKLQVFHDYKNGTWAEDKNSPETPLPNRLINNLPQGRITLFTPFKDIIPVPEGVAAVQARGAFTRNSEEIVHGREKMNMRILDFSLNSERYPVLLNEQEKQRYLVVPESIARDLKDIVAGIILENDDVRAKANKTAQFLRDNFSYSLDVNFTADDKGLIKMLKERKPAYCTYFASALALLLRSEGIPARVAAGFYTTEIIDKGRNLYLVRVNNAHAWTEVYAPLTDPDTGRTVMIWRRLDATPSGFSNEVSKSSGFVNFEAIFENMWLAILNLNASVENMDKDQVKMTMIYFLILVMAVINRKNIFSALSFWLAGRKKTVKSRRRAPERLSGIYLRYESLLKAKFGESRRLSDTDQDVIERIRAKISAGEKVAFLETFVGAYQAARFGTGPGEDLERLLEEIRKTELSE